MSEEDLNKWIKELLIVPYGIEITMTDLFNIITEAFNRTLWN